MSTSGTSKVAAGWIPLVVLAVDPEGWFPFGPVKWFVVATGVLVLTAMTAAARRVAIEPRVVVVLLAFVGVFAVAAIRGVDRTYAWTGTPERHFGVLTWLLLVLVLVVGINLREPRAVLWGTAVAGVGLGACAVAEACGWEPRVFAVDDRLSATFGSPAYLGAASSLLLPIVIGSACDRSLSTRLRVVATAGAPLLVVALLGSGARAAWLGIGTAVILVAARRGRDVVARVPARAIAVALGGLVVTAVAVAAWSPVGARVTSLFDDDAPGGQGRLDEWRVASHVARDHLVFGVGPEGYRIAFAEGVDAAYERAHGRDPAPDRAHAAPLDVLLTGGLAALALWITGLALVGRFVWRALRDDRIWVVGMGSALIAHVVGQLVLFPLAELEPVAWLLAGVVIASTSRASERRAVALPRLVAIVPAAAAALALAAGVTDVVADRRAYDATVALARGDTERAYRRASDAAAQRPDEIRLHLLKAETARQADRGTVEALAAIDDALAVSPRDPIVVQRRLTLLVERAGATLVPAHAAEANDAIAAAVARDPNNAQLRLLEGQAARLGGDDAHAEAAWRRAEELSPRSPVPPADLALLYADQGRLADARAAFARAVRIAPDDALVATVQRRLDELEGSG